MVEFLVRRAFISAVTLLLISVIVFTGVRMIPGDPARVLGGTDADAAGLERFHLVGEEELETRMGRLVTWHLRRPPKPGTYSSQLDIWLAPSMQWYPVQIRNTEANGALTTQTVTQIRVNDATGK